MLKTIIIIQARMGSSRLPGKILKPLGKHNVLYYVIERCKKIEEVEEVIIATSVLPQDDLVEDWCNENNVKCYRGSENDVLDRYVQCAKLYETEYVIRVTADCPFVDYELANEIITKMKDNPVDIIDVSGDFPRGLTVEMISFDALKYIHKNGKENRHREHVTYYAYEYPDEFVRTVYSIPKEYQHPQLRMTLDTEEDYQLCKKVVEYYQDPLITSKEIIQYLLDSPEVAILNAHIEQKPVV